MLNQAILSIINVNLSRNEFCLTLPSSQTIVGRSDGLIRWMYHQTDWLTYLQNKESFYSPEDVEERYVSEDDTAFPYLVSPIRFLNPCQCTWKGWIIVLLLCWKCWRIVLLLCWLVVMLRHILTCIFWGSIVRNSDSSQLLEFSTSKLPTVLNFWLF